jgi:cob(I)alamin adenosyltransferase
MAAQKLDIEWYKTGDGWTWKTKDKVASMSKVLQGWELAKQKIASGDYDLIVLDEFTYPLAFDWLNVQEIIEWLLANKPSDLHLIITGRNAPPALIEYADLVTKMEEVKHPYNNGIKAQPGIDF